MHKPLGFKYTNIQTKYGSLLSHAMSPSPALYIGFGLGLILPAQWHGFTFKNLHLRGTIRVFAYDQHVLRVLK